MITRVAGGGPLLRALLDSLPLAGDVRRAHAVGPQHHAAQKQWAAGPTPGRPAEAHGLERGRTTGSSGRRYALPAAPQEEPGKPAHGAATASSAHQRRPPHQSTLRSGTSVMQPVWRSASEFRRLPSAPQNAPSWERRSTLAFRRWFTEFAAPTAVSSDWKRVRLYSPRWRLHFSTSRLTTLFYLIQI